MPELVVVCGLAGSGKTELLGQLAAAGEQTLDLEALARHRGSAFGGLGLPPQPTHAQFHALVEEALATADPARRLWVEDEGPFIGAVGVPPALQAAMRAAPVVRLDVGFEQRLERVAAEYGRYPPADLALALRRSSPRLGERRTTRALAELDRGRVRDTVAVVLPYFDACYRHRALMDDRPPLALSSDTEIEPAEHARRLSEASITPTRLAGLPFEA